jgi:hypothetical protein
MIIILDNKQQILGNFSSNPYNDFIGKTILSIYFICQGFVSIETFPKRERFNSDFFSLTILPGIVGSVSVLRSKIRIQGYWLHVDNAKLHNAALSL